VAVVATLSKGYDLEYIWKPVDRGPPRTRPATTSRPRLPIRGRERLAGRARCGRTGVVVMAWIASVC
jgi:hypothetical protein